MLLALFACNATTTSATVGSDGAELELPGGGTLTIPAGALSEDVDIEATLITDLSGWADFPSALEAPRYAVALTPHGLQFDEPVTLGLPHGGWDVRLAVLRADDESDTDWSATGPVVEAGDLATIELAGFSGYALSTVPDGACPCFDATDVFTFHSHGQGLGWPGSTYLSGPALVSGYDDASGHAHINQQPGYCAVTATPDDFDDFFPELEATTKYSRSHSLGTETTAAEEAACTALINAAGGGPAVLGPLDDRGRGLGVARGDGVHDRRRGSNRGDH